MKQFTAQETTTQSKEVIWQIWADVSQWHVWDTELESAKLEGAFLLNTRGILKPKKGPASRFVITELTEGESFTFQVQLPLATLDVAHYFLEGKRTTFVHEVSFNGPLGWLFGRILGGGYAAALPQVLKRIKTLAEQPDLLITHTGTDAAGA